jgi:succinate dehydrogenase/fumarate reductase flavoprotein subunit
LNQTRPRAGKHSFRALTLAAVRGTLARGGGACLTSEAGVIRERDVAHWHAEADLVVVGLGLGGVCAALEAARAGADVVALERASAGGGTSANSGGLIYLGGGTPVQKAAGFDDTPEEMFRFLCAIAQPGPDEERIRDFCEHSVEHFHWLEAQGLPFKRSFHPEPGLESRTDDCLVYSGGEDAAPWKHLARPAPRGHKPQTPGKAGPFLMQRMLAALAASPVRVETDVRAERLVVASDGRVLGVASRRAGGNYLARARRGVVLAAGGFIFDDEMLRLHAPLLARCSDRNGSPGDDGRGIRMGQAAGGATLRMNLGEVALPYTIPCALARGIYVNERGQRFINEDTYYGHVGIEALFHQGGRVWLLHDATTFARGLLHVTPCAVGETIEEIESEAGFPRGALTATVAYYNEHAACGEDPLFGKRGEMLIPLREAPFALVDCTLENARYATFTLGGLNTGARSEVRGADGAAVPGLYAAGRTAALFCGQGYPGSGISLADASFFGRVAARAALER